MSQTSDLCPAPRASTPKSATPGASSLDHAKCAAQLAAVEDSEAAPAKSGSDTKRLPREQPLHREIYLELHPEGPWTCVFCGGEVEELHVHHRDGDHSNNIFDNLAATHGDCHAHHHRTGAEKFDRPPKASALRIAAGSLDDIEALRNPLRTSAVALRRTSFLMPARRS